MYVHAILHDESLPEPEHLTEQLGDLRWILLTRALIDPTITLHSLRKGASGVEHADEPFEMWQIDNQGKIRATPLGGPRFAMKTTRVKPPTTTP